MRIKTIKYVHIQMTEDDAKRLVLFFDEIDRGTSNLPDWAKLAAKEYFNKFDKAGIKIEH